MGLASELERMMRVARLTQTELAAVARVGRNTIVGIMAGGSHTRPDTLLRLARGAATEGEGNGDEARAESYYGRLMAAAGYGRVVREEPASYVGDPAVTIGEGVDLSDDALRRILTRRTNDDTISADLLSLAGAVDDLDSDDLDLVRAAIALARQTAERRRRGRRRHH